MNSFDRLIEIKEAIVILYLVAFKKTSYTINYKFLLLGWLFKIFKRIK